jgi:hypothetical protein
MNSYSDSVQRQACFAALYVMLLVLTGSHVVWGQTASSSTIHGTVSDESGAALPGVTVTITSPALQVGLTSKVTEPDGTYRFGDLPVGTYKVTFELTGFKTFVRDEVRLPIGFVARIDAEMPIGNLEETITVSGAAPVVDLTTTTTSVNLTRDTLEAVPSGRGYQHLFAMTPGVTTSGSPDIGDSALASRSNIQSYGATAQAKIEVEGINISAGMSASAYLTTFSFEEIQIRTSGNDAEVSAPGISMVSVLKSGSNQFHGTYRLGYEGAAFESDNMTPKLRAQGLSASVPLRYYYEYSADLGGRLIRDKLWFYVARNKQARIHSPLGFASGPGPDGKYLTGDEPLADFENYLDDHAVKLSYQVSQKHRLVGVWQQGTKYQPQRAGTRFRPLESTIDYSNPGGIYKGELQSTLSSHFVANLVAGWGGNHEDYSVDRSKFGKTGPGNPSKLNRDTQLVTGSGTGATKSNKDRYQLDGSLSFFPDRLLGGRHEMKVGTTLYWHRLSGGGVNNSAGNYVLVYDAGQPVEIRISNAPNNPLNAQNIFAGYVKDTWRITDKVTANLGVRYEYQHAWVPEQSKEASEAFPTLFPAKTFPYQDIETWVSVVPRFGLAWSIGSKSVVKASFGRFNAGMLAISEGGYGSAYNGNGDSTATFRWRDPDGNGDYTPGEVNLATTGNTDFVTISGAANNLLNPDLKQPMTNETTVGFEHEIMNNLGFRALYVYRDYQDNVVTTNVLRPRSAYNIPLQRRDPGPDGLLNTADDAGAVTIWDYSPAFAGSSFIGNQRVNSPRTDYYHSTEFTLTRRSAGRWFGVGSFWLTKHHRWVSPFPEDSVYGDPNSDRFPLAENWTWGSNLSGNFRFPWDVNVGAFLQSKTGVQGQRTYIFRATDPDGGAPLRQLTTVTPRLEPFGAQQGPAITILNMKGSRAFRLGGSRVVEFNVEVFNLLNSSAPTQIVFDSGQTFGWFGSTSVSVADTGVLPARVARLGMRFSF